MTIPTNNPQKTTQFNPGRASQIITGLVTLSMGVVFLLSQTGLIDLPANWWAIYLLIPVVGLLIGAGYMYLNNGHRLSMGVLIQLLLALGIGTLAVSLMLGLYLPIDWGAIWPLAIIVVGLCMLFIRRD